MKKKFKSLLLKYGWKFGLLIFFGYLVRDVTLYILIPWLIASNFIN